MKKLLYAFVCITAITFASCGNKVVSNDTNVDTLEVVDTIDTLNVDTI